MSNENKLTTSRGGAEIVEYVQPLEHAPPPAPLKPANPLLVVHALLRGRYAWAIGLAVLGAAIGAPIGYLLQKPEYKSEGLIKLEPYVDVIGDRGSSGSMPGFDQFLQAQAALIGSKRVLAEAMGQPDWKAFGRGLLPAAEAEFQGSVTVNIPTKGGSLIRVGFVDNNPRAAVAAVKAIITSYKTIYDQMEEEKFERPMNVLYSDRQKYKAGLEACTKQILDISNELQSVTPKEDYALKRDWLNQLQRQVAQLKLQGGGGSGAGGNGPATAPATQPAEMPFEMLVNLDAKLNKLQSQRDEAARNARFLAQKFGDNHPQVKDAQFTLKLLDEEIDVRVGSLRGQPTQAGGAVAGGQLATARIIDPVELQRQFEDAKRETERFGQKVIQIDQLRETARIAHEQLDFVNREIERRDRQRQLGGRMEVMSYGDLPFSPTKDRRKALAAVGGMGMAGLGVGVVLLLGFLDRRMHHIDAARSRLRPAERLLGVLPELPSDFADPVAAADTAHCVHRIRAMLQIRQRASGHKTYAITSPAPGDGKTSLTITLGMSLASSGCRTVLVDCDMDGRGLSAKLARNARRPIGQVLLDMGMLGEANLQEAVELARERGVRLGAALVQLGHATQAQVEQALRVQRAAAPGLAEALGGEAFEKALHPTAYPHLSVLPLGTTVGSNAGKFAPQALRRLLDRLAERFDAVLIDCGPILGSVEAAIVAAEADGVILLVSRGGDRKAAENAVGMLAAAGASVEGVVFNRALPHDLMVSGYSSSSSRGMYASRERKATAPAAQQ
jgi:Mrp family chromosome partitioning ATPase